MTVVMAGVMDNVSPAPVTPVPMEFAILDQMANAGEKISVRSFRARLGGGSMDRVANLLRAWREKREDRRPPVPTQVGANLTAVSTAIWNQALDQARREVAQEVQSLREQAATLNGSLISAETQVEESRDLAASAQSLALTEREARTLLAAHQDELQAQRSQAVAAADKALQEANAAHQRLTEEMGRHTATAHELAQAKDSLVQAAQQLDHHRRQAEEREATLREANARLETEMAHLRNQVHDLNGELKRQSQIANLLEAALQQEKAHAATAQAAVLEKTTALNQTQAALLATQETLTHLQGQVLQNLTAIDGRIQSVSASFIDEVRSVIASSQQAADARHQDLKKLLQKDGPQ